MQAASQSSVQNSSNLEHLAHEAITAALSLSWEDAIKINKKILRISKSNTEALNRLARAYCCTKDYSKAERLYKKVLAVDPFNIIALKNKEKVAQFNGKSNANNKAEVTVEISPPSSSSINLSKIFLDEPGKTKLVGLLNLAPPSTLAGLNCGDKVTLKAKNHSVTVLSENGTYLGAFPDDLAHRIISFISGGNEYEAYVKSSTVKALTIFVRETIRSSKFSNQPTFQSRVNLFEGTTR